MRRINRMADEKIFHARWADYTKQPLNIGGICLPFIFTHLGGVACVIIVDFIYLNYSKNPNVYAAYCRKCIWSFYSCNFDAAVT